MKKIIILFILFLSFNLVFAAPEKTSSSQKSVAVPEFNQPDSRVFDISAYSIRDNFYVADFSRQDNFILSVYLYDGTSWILATRYSPDEFTKQNDDAFSYDKNINNKILFKEKKDSLDLNRTIVYSYFTDKLDQYKFVAISVSNPNINIEYGEYHHDLYFTLTKKLPEQKISKIDCSTIDSYYTVGTSANTKEAIKRNIYKDTFITNISENKDFCCLLYGINQDKEKNFIGLAYFNRLGQQVKLDEMNENMLNYKFFYIKTDDGKEYNLKASFVKNSLYFTIE